MAAGKPNPRDFEGVWSSASITFLERPPALKTLELTEAEAQAYEAQHPGSPEVARNSGVGQEDSEWWEMGGKLGRIRGRARSSWIVDPADGRLPYSTAGLAVLQKAQEAIRATDNPEARLATDRCLMGAGGSSLPPMLNSSYNSHLRIVQTRDHVVVAPEMGAGPRIIPLDGRPLEPGPAWAGQSHGHWEGDVLVVETTGFHPGARWRGPGRLYTSSAARVTERFRRTGPDEILYSFEVDDPAVFTTMWRGEMPLRRSSKPMFEFACHEGNYSLPGILGGGREQERAAAKK
jgi:hypothetical protein